MYKTIDSPPILNGSPDQKLEQVRSYLFGVVEALNQNLESIGGNDLSDAEQAAMQGIMSTGDARTLNNVSSLRELIVRTVEYFKKALTQIEKVPLSVEVNNGHFATYVRAVEIQTAADLNGNNKDQTLTALLQALKLDDLHLRNHIYTGVLRNVGGTDIYGTAIGKDVVTWDANGVETFDPDKTVLEIVDERIRIMDGGEEVLIIDSAIGGGGQYAEVKPGLDADYVKYKGIFDGPVLSQETQETSYDDITDPGSYWIDVTDVADGPSDLTSGEYLLEVFEGTNAINQRISTGTAIYTREKRSGTWAGWYKFQGTSV